MATLLGFIAAALSTVSLVPQVVRTLRTRSASGLAWAYLLTMLLASATWTCYGVMNHDYAVIIANAVAASLASVIASTKYLETRRLAAPLLPGEAPVPLEEFAELVDLPEFTDLPELPALPEFTRFAGEAGLASGAVEPV